MLDDILFVSTDLHERTVELPGGTSVKLHFRELPAVAFMRFQSAQGSGDDDARAEAIARLIADSVCNPDGTPGMTLEKALTLKTGAMTAIFAEVLRINGSAQGND